MKIGAFIPARSSSRRLPAKNFRVINGKPLACWTIDKALEADVFDDITVSVDSAEGADILRAVYPESAVKILIRPDELCAYDTDLNDCIIHYLHNRPDIEVVGALMPTFPFRSIATLRTIDTHFRSRYIWKATSVYTDGLLTPDYYYETSAGMKRIFDSRPMCCAAYMGAYSYWHRNIFGGLWTKYPLTMSERVLYVSVDAAGAIDIDSMEDFELAEAIFSGAKLVPRPCVEHEYKDWIIITPKGVSLDSLLDYIGPEQLDNFTHPLVVLKKVKHFFARFLKFENYVGRLHFSDINAYKHIVCPDGLVSHQSQTFPDEYRACPSYRFLRMKDKKYSFSTQGSFPDVHGVDFSNPFSSPDILEETTCNGAMFTPNVLPRSRVIDWEELQRQPFFLPPLMLLKD